MTVRDDLESARQVLTEPNGTFLRGRTGLFDQCRPLEGGEVSAVGGSVGPKFWIAR